MSAARSIPTAIVALALFAGGAVIAVPHIAAAHSGNAQSNLGLITEQQAAWESNDGFAPSLEAIVVGDIFTELPGAEHPVAFTQGTTIAYLVNSTRTHYVAAELLASGEVSVNGDEGSASILCESYTVECVAQVTSDAELLAAVPVWVAF